MHGVTGPYGRAIIVNELGFSTLPLYFVYLEIYLIFLAANLETILLSIPRSVTSVIIFLIVGVVTSKVKNLRLYIMGAATIPPLIGFLGMALIPTREGTKVRMLFGFLARKLH